jgi:hypothetical protein
MQLIGSAQIRRTLAYDSLVHPISTVLTPIGDAALLFEEVPHFDYAGDVVTLATTLPGVADSQQFCYDDPVGRLSWAGNSGTPPCTGQPLTQPATAPYAQAYHYDSLDRLTGGPSGTYTYGTAGPLHAATAIGAAYTAAYDAAGDMTCRAPQATATCAGASPTGASLGYDAAGRLATWASQPTNPSATDAFLYDGAGDRVAQRVVQNGATTTTVYVGDLEAISTTGSSTTTTAYYYMAGAAVRRGGERGALVPGERRPGQRDGGVRRQRQRAGAAALRALRRGALRQRDDADGLRLHGAARRGPPSRPSAALRAPPLSPPSCAPSRLQRTRARRPVNAPPLSRARECRGRTARSGSARG